MLGTQRTQETVKQAQKRPKAYSSQGLLQRQCRGSHLAKRRQKLPVDRGSS